MGTNGRGDELFASHGDRISSLIMGGQLDIAKGEKREKTRELESPSGLLATNLGSCDGTGTRVMLQGAVTCLGHVAVSRSRVMWYSPPAASGQVALFTSSVLKSFFSLSTTPNPTLCQELLLLECRIAPILLLSCDTYWQFWFFCFLDLRQPQLRLPCHHVARHRAVQYQTPPRGMRSPHSLPPYD